MGLLGPLSCLVTVLVVVGVAKPPVWALPAAGLLGGPWVRDKAVKASGAQAALGTLPRQAP